SGTISASNVGIDFDGARIRIVNDGEISGKSDAILLDEGEEGVGSNTILNTGKISATTGNAMDIAGGSNKINNAGTISASSVGISLNGSNDGHGHNVVINSGTVSGGDGAVFVGSLAGDVDGVHNSGTLQAMTLGIAETGFGSLYIANSGVIDSFDAVLFDSSGADSIDNSGTIIGSGLAIEELGTGKMTVVNTGHITGGIQFGDGGGTYNGVLGTVDGLVSGGAASDTIKGGADGENLSGGAGDDLIKGGTGDDVITGGAGADKLISGGGNNTFVYTAVTESRSGPATHDTVVGFDALNDVFDLEVAVTGVDKMVKAGTLDKSSFNTDMQAMLPATALHAHHAVLVTPSTGDLAGHTFLVVDDNGVAGFQAGGDYVIELSQGVHLANLSVTNFI
ncbi:MAG TPA: bluetail domain-containing putative surface protein, partial [Rhizomicrobium sp.]